MYRLQGVKINDKHIEVIIRQMLRRVRIVEPGDTRYLGADQVERSALLEENDALEAEEKPPRLSLRCCSASQRRRLVPIPLSLRPLSRKPPGS